MLGVVFQKIRNKKWMFISLLLGNLLMIAIAAAGPMYSHAALQNMMTKSLNNYLVENNTEPGAVIVRNIFDSSTSKKEEKFQKVEQCFVEFDNMLRELEIPVIHAVTHIYKTNVRGVNQNGRSLDIRLDCFQNLEEHVRITDGTMYSSELDGNVIDVIVNERTFVEKRLMLGEEFELTQVKNASGEPYKLRIAGIFEKSLEQDSYWMNDPMSWMGVCVMDPQLFTSLFYNKNNDVNAESYAVLDYLQMRGDQAERYIEVVEKYQDVFADLNVTYTKFNFQSTLQNFLPEAAKVNTTIWVLLLPIFALLAAFIFMVSRQMLDMEQNEIAIYKSRGANKRQIIMIYVLQSICVSMVSIAGGIPLGLFMCKILGASNAFLEFVKRTALPIEITPQALTVAGIAALFSICTMVFPVFRFANVNIVAHKRQKNRKSKSALWEMLCVDIILLGVSMYGLYQYNRQKSMLAQQVLEGGSLDPLLYICSSLFMLGAGLLVLRIFPWVIKFIFWLGQRWWKPSLYASFLRIIRTRSNQGFLMVFLILTVAMGIYNAQAARTINANAEEKIQYINGADLVLQENWGKVAVATGSDGSAIGFTEEIVEPDFGKYQSMDGIENVTKVLIDNKVGARLSSGTLNNITLMGIHTKEFGQIAWFKESLLPLHYHEYLNAISQNSKAILVSSNFREIYGYETGDFLSYYNEEGKSIRGVICGFVDYWPTYAPKTYSKGSDGLFQEKDNFLIVANLAQVQAVWGITPYQVWIKAEDSTQFMYDYAAETSTNYVSFKDSVAELIALKKDPVFQATNGILNIGFICILLMCSMGFLIYWILSIQSRTLQFGIFRAMGMSMREVFTMLLNEQLWITGISIVSGAVVGIITSKLFVPLIQIAYSAADQVIPLEIISEGSDYVRLFAVIGTVIMICMVILGMLISKIKIAQALKLGED